MLSSSSAEEKVVWSSISSADSGSKSSSERYEVGSSAEDALRHDRYGHEVNPFDEFERVDQEVYEDDDLGLMSIADEVDEDMVVLIEGIFDSGEMKYVVYIMKQRRGDVICEAQVPFLRERSPLGERRRLYVASLEASECDI